MPSHLLLYVLLHVLLLVLHVHVLLLVLHVLHVLRVLLVPLQVLLHVPLPVLHAACMCCCVRRGFTHLQIAGTIIIAIFNTPVMMGNTPNK